jgi:hypothetical protein
MDVRWHLVPLLAPELRWQSGDMSAVSALPGRVGANTAGRAGYIGNVYAV